MAQVNTRRIGFGSNQAIVYQRSDIPNGSWFFRMRLKAERKPFRKALDTNNEQDALARGHDLLIEILAKLKSGEKLLALTVGELIRRWQLHQQELYDTGQQAKKTLKVHVWQVQKLKAFLKAKLPAGLNTQLPNIDGSLFNEYLVWKQSINAELRRDGVHNELLGIRKMFLWAVEQKLCPESVVPKWSINLEREGPKRQRITDPKQFATYINTMLAWAKKDLEQRRPVVQIVTMAAMTGMRSGELFGLKPGDLTARGKDEFVVTIRPETTKVRKGRTITLVSKPLANWLVIRPDTAYLFGTTPRMVSTKFYRQYGSLRKALGELDWFDLYHCRHVWITNQLMMGQPIHLVAKVAGTSTARIEETYSHVLTEQVSRSFLNKQIRWDADGAMRVEPRR